MGFELVGYPLRKRLLLPVAALVLLSACGRWLPEDVRTDDRIGELGAAGYQRVCDAFDGYVRDQYAGSHLIQAVCLAQAVQSKEGALECGDQVQLCTSTLPPPAEVLLAAILAQASCTALALEPTGCSATVAELVACLDALEDRLDALKFGATCAVAGQPIEEDWWRISRPAACEGLASLCPPAS